MLDCYINISKILMKLMRSRRGMCIRKMNMFLKLCLRRGSPQQKNVNKWLHNHLEQTPCWIDLVPMGWDTILDEDVVNK